MKMKVVYSSGSWFIGRRGLREIGFLSHETRGTHHFTVLAGDDEFSRLVGREIAVPVSSVEYFILNYEI